MVTGVNNSVHDVLGSLVFIVGIVGGPEEGVRHGTKTGRNINARYNPTKAGADREAGKRAARLVTTQRTPGANRDRASGHQGCPRPSKVYMRRGVGENVFNITGVNCPHTNATCTHTNASMVGQRNTQKRQKERPRTPDIHPAIFVNSDRSVCQEDDISVVHKRTHMQLQLGH